MGFQPTCPIQQTNPVTACYRSHENIKKRAYEQHIRQVEHVSFTALVLSATGGMARQATSFYKRLATLLATKWNQPYSSTISWLHCRLTFSLLHGRPFNASEVLGPAVVMLSDHHLQSTWSPVKQTTPSQARCSPDYFKEKFFSLFSFTTYLFLIFSFFLYMYSGSVALAIE